MKEFLLSLRTTAEMRLAAKLAVSLFSVAWSGADHGCGVDVDAAERVCGRAGRHRRRRHLLLHQARCSLSLDLRRTHH